jgi:hypothetical protein
MGTIPSGVPLGLVSNIQVEFGPNAGVTADNLLGYLSRDISIPTAAPLKYGDFVGKGRHTGRRESMLAFLAGCPYNPYSAYAALSNGLVGYSPPRYGYAWSDALSPFVRTSADGGCGLYATLNNTQTISTFVSNNTLARKSEHCVENTLITIGVVEDGTNGTTLNNLGGSSTALGASTSTTHSVAGGQVRAFRTSNTLKFKNMANISASFSGGGCNGNGACGWFLFPNKWEITSNLGYSSGTTINATFQPWEACLVHWRTGSDNASLDSNNTRLLYGSNQQLGACMATSGNWYGGSGFSLFVNWTGSPQVFTITNSTFSAQTIHKIYFVGDQYTLDLN